MRVGKYIVLIVLSVVLAGCHKTAPQSPSQRSGQETKQDTALLSLMEVNRRMANQADTEVQAYVDSIQRVTGDTYGLMSCGGWKRRRTLEEKRASLFADEPQSREKWEVRLKTFRLDGQLIKDEQGVYQLKHYDLPIAIEEALENMCAGESSDLVAPWYCAYGFRGRGPVRPYESVAFKVTLIEKVN